jgi:hypothetical protein
VLHDFQGQFIAASCKYIPSLPSLEMAEALSMKEGLILANSKGCNSVIAEGDSLETIQACAGSDAWWTEPAAIYADCVDIATLTGQVFFRHGLREHVICRECFNSRLGSHYMEEHLPPDIPRCDGHLHYLPSYCTHNKSAHVIARECFNSRISCT